MASMIELINLLAENEKIMTELASALNEEQHCIIDLDLKRLGENGGRKETITARMINMREECHALMQNAGSELGLKETPNLSTLIAASAAAEQIRLRPLQQRLMRLANTLERQHRTNQRMLENSVSMIRKSMALFGRLLGGCDTYSPQGRIRSGGVSGSIFRQEI